MISRIVNYPQKQSFFLFGARGTGKSSWVKAAFPNALYLDLLDAEIYRELLSSPKRLEQRLPAQAPEWVVIDEIQKIPELLDEVHRLIESRKLKFILTGSSARKLKKVGANLLAGRALRLEMTPLHSIELGARFDLKRALQFGMLPYSYLESEDLRYLKTYVTTFLKEEIQQEALVRNLGNFSRFLEAASFSQGSQLNTTNVAAESHAGRKAVEGYFQILEDFLIASKVPVFTKRAKRKMVSHPKFYFFDTGLFRALRPRGPLDQDQEVGGIAFETLVYQELVGLKRVLNLEFEIFFWRPSREREVDFVLYGPDIFKAIEVKYSQRLRAEDFEGLKDFHADFPQAHRMLVYGGDRSFHHEGIEVLSARDYFARQRELFAK